LFNWCSMAWFIKSWNLKLFCNVIKSIPFKYCTSQITMNTNIYVDLLAYHFWYISSSNILCHKLMKFNVRLIFATCWNVVEFICFMDSSKGNHSWHLWILAARNCSVNWYDMNLKWDWFILSEFHKWFKIIKCDAIRILTKEWTEQKDSFSK
jgi:hypothetical protein